MTPDQLGASCIYESGRLTAGRGWVSSPGGPELTSRAVALAGLGRSARVLDLGCGSGESVRFLRSIGIDATGLDQSPSCVEGYLHVHAAAEKIPLSDSTFDGVLAECSLSVMRSPVEVVSECARVLRPGGKLMIADLYARAPEAIAAVRELDSSCVSGMIVRTELEGWLCESGFEVQCFEDHSKALREATARFIFEHGDIEALWTRGAEDANRMPFITCAMKQVKPGYFLLIATRKSGRG